MGQIYICTRVSACVLSRCITYLNKLIRYCLIKVGGSGVAVVVGEGARKRL